MNTHAPSPRPRSLVLACAFALTASGCAATRGGPPLTTLGREHVRAGYRGWFEGAAIMLPVLDCTSNEVVRVPNLPARAAMDTVASELWQQLHLPGVPDADDAENLPERARLCRELSDNLDSGTNYVTASPAMRELLRDFFTRHSERAWFVVAARWLWLGDGVRDSGDRGALGVLERRRLETDFLDASLYIFSRGGDVAYRADLFCRGPGLGERHDCGASFEKLNARVAELLDGFPRSIVERPAIVRTGGLIPMRRLPDPVIDLKNPAAVKLPDPAAVPQPLEPPAKVKARAKRPGKRRHPRR